jgi:HD superfamily phosphohydrolase
MANDNPRDEGQLTLTAGQTREGNLKGIEGPVEKVARNADLNPSLTSRTRSSKKKDRQEIFLPVSGFVWLFPEEIAVVNHPAFQRLGRIYQLGQAYVVFRGATHKRLEHVIGALHVVGRMIAAVATNSEKLVGSEHWAPKLSDTEERFVRLGTLLHDIGHMAAGHTVEDELRLVSKHDSDERLDVVLNETTWNDRQNRTLGELLDQTYGEYVPEELRAASVKASEIVRLLIRKRPGKEDRYASASQALEKSGAIRLQICRDMIGNTICADLLDYIHRDWYHVGKPRPFDDRLLQYMEIRRGADGRSSGLPEATDKFVISLGSRPKIRTDAVSNILDLLEWRYSLAETVLFHRTKLAAAAMLDRALYELWGGDNESQIVRFLLPLSDEEMLSRCREKAESISGDNKPSGETRERAGVASRILANLEKRELYCHLSTRFASDLPGDRVEKIKSTYARNEKDAQAPARNRNSVVRTLEQDFGLPRGAIAMYCPTEMNRKIAEVQIAVGDETEQFYKYEAKYHQLLSGGHLDAQLLRFDRLWRVHFFIERSAKESLGDRLFLLEQAIEKLALGYLVDDESSERVALSLARLLTQTEGSPWLTFRVSSTPLSAKSDSATAPEGYPTGAPSIRAFVYK